MIRLLLILFLALFLPLGAYSYQNTSVEVNSSSQNYHELVRYSNQRLSSKNSEREKIENKYIENSEVSKNIKGKSKKSKLSHQMGIFSLFIQFVFIFIFLVILHRNHSRY